MNFESRVTWIKVHVLKWTLSVRQRYLCVDEFYDGINN